MRISVLNQFFISPQPPVIFCSAWGASTIPKSRMGTMDLVAANVNWRIRSAGRVSAVSQRRLQRVGSLKALNPKGIGRALAS